MILYKYSNLSNSTCEKQNLRYWKKMIDEKLFSAASFSCGGNILLWRKVNKLLWKFPWTDFLHLHQLCRKYKLITFYSHFIKQCAMVILELLQYCCWRKNILEELTWHPVLKMLFEVKYFVDCDQWDDVLTSEMMIPAYQVQMISGVIMILLTTRGETSLRSEQILFITNQTYLCSGRWTPSMDQSRVSCINLLIISSPWPPSSASPSQPLPWVAWGSCLLWQCPPGRRLSWLITTDPCVPSTSLTSTTPRWDCQPGELHTSRDPCLCSSTSLKIVSTWMSTLRPQVRPESYKHSTTVNDDIKI